MENNDSGRKKIIIAALVAVILLFLLLAVLLAGKKKPAAPEQTAAPPVENTGGNSSPVTFDPGTLKKEYKIGQVIVKNSDLENKFSVLYPNTPASRNNKTNWEKAAKILTEEAILQNEYIASKNIVVANNDYNPKIANQARDYYNSSGTSYVSGETFSIWFHNTTPPAMGVDAAKAKTKPIMEELRKKVIEGKLTMRSAADAIKSMKELESIDPAYRGNSYFSFPYVKPGQKSFNDDNLDTALWKMDNGEISEVLTGRDSGTNGWYDAYYIVIKVSSKKTTEFNNADDIVKKRTTEGMKITL